MYKNAQIDTYNTIIALLKHLSREQSEYPPRKEKISNNCIKTP